jgi:hypothetical protein
MDQGFQRKLIMSGEPVDTTVPILTSEAKMLQQMISKLDEQLQELEFNKLKLCTVRDALLKNLGLTVEQLELPLALAEDEGEEQSSD